jgi:hypothetical protein
MAELFSFPRAAAVYGQRPPSPTPTEEAEDGTHRVELAPAEVTEIEPREENREGMTFGPSHGYGANYTVNNADIVTIEQTNWHFRRGETFTIANLVRTINDVNVSHFQRLHHPPHYFTYLLSVYNNPDFSTIGTTQSYREINLLIEQVCNCNTRHHRHKIWKAFVLNTPFQWPETRILNMLIWEERADQADIKIYEVYQQWIANHGAPVRSTYELLPLGSRLATNYTEEGTRTEQPDLH